MDLQVGGARTVIRLRGDVDAAAARDILAVADAATARGGLRRVVLDLTGVRFLGAAGLDAVLQIRELCIERELDVEVETNNAAVRDAVLRHAGPARVTELTAIPATAIAAMPAALHTSEPDGTAAGLTSNRGLRLAQ